VSDKLYCFDIRTANGSCEYYMVKSDSFRSARKELVKRVAYFRPEQKFKVISWKVS
jgi:hypothetical protein